MKEIQRVAEKEFSAFFSSPAAFLFLGAFLAVTLFVFYWVETFFARNIADVRPMFVWMPILLIFLVSALTMRAWSEERRSGTLESLLTSPVHPIQLILGKFLAGLGLVAIALLVTLPLPLTVALIGPLDWGPVIGGYVAALFLAAAYVSIGLFMSARTDNPIVALILSSVVCGLFYLIGSSTFTTLFGHTWGGFFALLGSGSRFESITRGVLDFRDLYYYLSIVGVFLTLNFFTLEKLRWAGNPPSAKHGLWGWMTLLVVLNFVAGNLWLHPIGWARTDITEGEVYSLSPATGRYLDQLQEPLLIRGYFTSKTHPLLAPLVPQLKDLLKEYAVLGGDRVHVEFVDPLSHPDLEEEAASQYGIKPVPFQMASKYQASVVNSYFDILIAYGDQHEVLGYSDLIEVKVRGAGQDLDVTLKNPEYAITSAIRKTLTGFQSGGTPFETLKKTVVFTGYLSAREKLPKGLLDFRKALDDVLEELKGQSGGKLTARFLDPEANGGVLGKELEKDYGFGPQIASLFDPQPFWFYMMLESGGEAVQVPLPNDLSKEALKQSIEATLKRMAPGFLKTVTLVLPKADNPYGMGGKRYTRLKDFLAESVRVKEDDLKRGRVPEETDLLLVLAPKDLDEKQLFAIDQFLMRGGTTILATSPFDASINEALTAKKVTTGLKPWLAHVGLSLEEEMILDEQNGALPIPVQRYIGPIAVREIRMLPYSYFADIRDKGLNGDSPITAGLGQLTVNWPSPLVLNDDKLKGKTVVRLLTTSEKSWRSDQLNIVPNLQQYPDLGFATEGEPEPLLIAALVEGRFDSYFVGRESPLLKAEGASATRSSESDADHEGHGHDAGQGEMEDDDPKGDKSSEMVVSSVLGRSSESARLVVIGSQGFAEDTVLELASQGMGTQYTKPLELIQNAIDWSLEDRGLLTIRSRNHYSRILPHMGEGEQRIIEYISDGLALLALLAVWGWRKRVRRAKVARHQSILEEA